MDQRQVRYLDESGQDLGSHQSLEDPVHDIATVEDSRLPSYSESGTDRTTTEQELREEQQTPEIDRWAELPAAELAER